MRFDKWIKKKIPFFSFINQFPSFFTTELRLNKIHFEANGMQGQQKKTRDTSTTCDTIHFSFTLFSSLFFSITSNPNLVYCVARGAFLLLSLLRCARDIHHIEWHNNKKKVMLCEKKIEGHNIMKVIPYASNWNVGDVWLISIARPHHFRLLDQNPTKWEGKKWERRKKREFKSSRRLVFATEFSTTIEWTEHLPKGNCANDWT